MMNSNTQFKQRETPKGPNCHLRNQSRAGKLNPGGITDEST